MSTEILIIDDNADIRNIINDLIIEAGYKTRLAANYNQALIEIDKKLPDVAIIDVKLDKSDNDGLELLSHIKTKDKNIPVIIITGHANVEMAIKALKAGAFEFIEKPFNIYKIMSTEILIIDDNADIRNIINDLIIEAGYKTRLAANYNQALNEIDKKLPDVAIIDVKLDKSDNDGLELLSHIKTKDKNIPVIINYRACEC